MYSYPSHISRYSNVHSGIFTYPKRLSYMHCTPLAMSLITLHLIICGLLSYQVLRIASLFIISLRILFVFLLILYHISCITYYWNNPLVDGLTSISLRAILYNLIWQFVFGLLLDYLDSASSFIILFLYLDYIVPIQCI